MRVPYGRDRSTYALLAPRARRVKVGSSEFVDKRIRTLARNSAISLVLIGLVEKNVERKIHEAIWDHRTHGEWFVANDQVLAIIASHMPRINRPVDAADRVTRSP